MSSAAAATAHSLPGAEPVTGEPVFLGNPTDAELSQQLLSPVWTPAGKGFKTLMTIAAAGTGLLFAVLGYTIYMGIGVWGNNMPVAWGFGIINFVWWVGIGHAGTFISAFLLLLEQKWRTSINRFTEAMTLFAVVQAGLFPLMHMGRPWFGYWLFPYPPTMKMWPNFKSALPWDAVAISTYLTVSLVFWYVGLIPDFAALRDSAPGKTRRIVYGIFALGWKGSARDYRHYRQAYGLLAGLAAPLVVSVHSIVSTDFATTLVPGWHSTVFPPYFVAGAIFSGFAMVLTLMIPARRVFHMENVITRRHLDAIAKMILVTGWVVTYAYCTEFFMSWYSGDDIDIYTRFVAYTTGPNSTVFWVCILCNCILPNILWSKRARTNEIILWIISITVNIGMWGERFMIIVLSLQREYLPSKWHSFSPTWVDISIFVGTLCFFSFLFMLFLRFVPMIALSEVKELKHELVEGHH